MQILQYEHENTCEVCKKVFITHGNRKKRKYCSRSCFGIGMAKYKDENGLPLQRTNKKAFEVIRGKIYRQTERGKEVWRNMMRRQYYKHREKVLARQSLNQQLKKGNIQKPKVCSVCKKHKKLEAHHEDYTKPLLVVWCCRQCHRILDKMLDSKSKI